MTRRTLKEPATALQDGTREEARSKNARFTDDLLGPAPERYRTSRR
jgi:hypothetical protein